MVSAFVAGLPVRLGSATNTQGMLLTTFLYLLRRTRARMPVIASLLTFQAATASDAAM